MTYHVIEQPAFFPNGSSFGTNVHWRVVRADGNRHCPVFGHMMDFPNEEEAVSAVESHLRRTKHIGTIVVRTANGYERTINA